MALFRSGGRRFCCRFWPRHCCWPCSLPFPCALHALRYLASLAGALLALSLLPPYPAILTAYQDPLYRGQLFLSVGACLLALLSPLAVRLPRPVVAAAGALLALVGWAPAIGMFLRVRPLFAALYGAPVGIGLGPILAGLGAAAGLGALGGALWVRTRARRAR